MLNNNTFNSIPAFSASTPTQIPARIKTVLAARQKVVAKPKLNFGDQIDENIRAAKRTKIIVPPKQPIFPKALPFYNAFPFETPTSFQKDPPAHSPTFNDQHFYICNNASHCSQTNVYCAVTLLQDPSRCWFTATSGMCFKCQEHLPATLLIDMHTNDISRRFCIACCNEIFDSQRSTKIDFQLDPHPALDKYLRLFRSIIQNETSSQSTKRSGEATAQALSDIFVSAEDKKLAEDFKKKIESFSTSIEGLQQTLSSLIDSATQLKASVSVISIVETIISFITHAMLVYNAPTTPFRLLAATAWMSSMHLISNSALILGTLGIAMTPAVKLAAVAHSQAGTDENVFYGLCLALAHTLGFGTQFDSDVDRKRMQNFSASVTGLKSIEYIVEKVTLAIKFIGNTLFSLPIGSKEECAAFAQDVDQYVKRVCDLQIGDTVLRIQTDQAVCYSVESLHKEGLDLVSRSVLLGVDGKLLYMHSFNQIFQTITHLHSVVIAKQRSSAERKMPVCVYLYGPPQQGKSELANELARQFFEICYPGIKFDKRAHVFAKGADTEFWDGYINQFCLILDDPFQRNDNENVVKVCSEIIHIVNTAPYQLNMSSITDKAGVFMQPQLVIITSNQEHVVLPVKNTLQSPEAFYARLHVPIHVTCKDEFLNSLGHVDSLKVKAIFDGISAYSPIHDFVYTASLNPTVTQQKKTFFAKSVHPPKRLTSVSDIIDLMKIEAVKRGFTPTTLDAEAEEERAFKALLSNKIIKHTYYRDTLKKLFDRANKDKDAKTATALKAKILSIQDHLDKFSATVYMPSTNIILHDAPCLQELSQTTSQAFGWNPLSWLFPAEDLSEGYFTIDDSVPLTETIKEELYTLYDIPYRIKAQRLIDDFTSDVNEVYCDKKQEAAVLLTTLSGQLLDYFSTPIPLRLNPLPYAPPVAIVPRWNIVMTVCGFLGLVGASFLIYKTARSMLSDKEASAEADLGSGDNTTKKNAYYKTIPNKQNTPNLTKLVPVSQMGDENTLNIIDLVAKNIGIIRWTDTLSNISGFVHIMMIKGRIGWIPYHFLARRKVGQTHLHLTFGSRKYSVPVTDLAHAEYGTDLTLLQINYSRFPEFKDLTGHFCPDESLGNIADVAIVLPRSDGSYTVHSGAASVDMTKKYRDTELDYCFVLGRHVRLRVKGAPGWCCAPYINMTPGVEKKLLALHVAGDEFNSYGHLIPNISGLSDAISQMSIEFPPGAVPIGTIKMNHPPILPIKTTLRISAIHEDLRDLHDEPPTTRPAPLRPFVNATGEQISPLYESLKKFDKKPLDPTFDSEILDEVETYCTNNLFNFDHQIRPYTLREALNGAEGNRFVKNMEFSKSAGTSTAPYYESVPKSRRDGKNFLNVELVDEKTNKLYTYPIPALAEDVQKWMDEAQNPPNTWVNEELIETCLKDERRSHEKCDAGLARIFQILPYKLLIIQRICYGSLIESVMSDPFGWCSLSLNPHNEHWKTLLSVLEAWGIDTRWLPGDYKNFDSVRLEIMCRINRVFRNYLALRGFPQYYLNVIDRLNSVLHAAVYLVTNIKWEAALPGDNPSGHLLTSILNCALNVFLHIACAVSVARQQKIPSTIDIRSQYSPSDYKNDFRLCTTGDDHIETTHVKWYTMALKAKEMKKLGFTYTDCKKRPIDSVTDYPRDEVTYLKRSFKIFEGRVAAPLDYTVVREMPKWIRKCNIPPRICTTQNCESARREWVHYGREEFDRNTLFYNALLAKNGCPLMTHKTYDGLLEEIYIYGRNDQNFEDVLAFSQMSTESTESTDQVQALTKLDDNVVEEIIVADVAKDVSPVLNFPDPYNHNAIKEILSRPVKFADFFWTGSDVTGTMIHQWVFPQDIFNVSQYFINAIANYRLFRSPIEIEIRVNSTDWHFGQLMFSMLPCGYNNPGAPWSPTNNAIISGHLNHFASLRQASMNPTALLSAQRKNVVKFVIPYLNNQSWYDLSDLGGETDVFGRMGILTCWVTAPLNQIGNISTPSVQVSLFARFTNPEVSALLPVVTAPAFKHIKTYPPQSELKEYFPVLLNDSDEFVALSQMSNENKKDGMTKTRDMKQSTGRVSGFLDKVSRSLLIMSPIPVVGKYLAGAAPVAAVASKVASILGFSRNTSNETMCRVLTAPSGNLVSGHDLDLGIKLALTPENKVDANFLNFCLEKDYDLISEYIRRPQLLYQGSIDDSTPSETVFHYVPISPSCWVRDFPSACFPSPMAQVSFLSQYWTGSMNVRVDFITSSRVSARIRATWVKYELNAPPLIVNDNDANNIVSEVFDITGDTVKYFNIPYVDKFPWLPTFKPSDNPFNNTYNGFLVFTIINQVVSADSAVSSTIYYNTWVGGGPDMKFSRPQDTFLRSSDYPNEALSQMSETPSTIAGPENSDYPVSSFAADFPSIIPATVTPFQGVTCGEVISRWSELASRYSQCQQVTSATNSLKTSFGWLDIMATYTNTWEPFWSRFFNSFLAYRGSLRFQQVCVDPGLNTGTQVYMTNVNKGIHVQRNGMAGITFGDTISRLPVCAEVPYYAQSAHQIRDVNPEDFGVGVYINSYVAGSRSVLYMAIGEDFSFGFPIAPIAVVTPTI
jgi:uncharacterized membrane protein